MTGDRCGTAEEVFEQFSDVFTTLVEAFEDIQITNHDYLRTLAQNYGSPSSFCTDREVAEHERCLRQTLRCSIVDVTLSGGSISNWEMRDDVAGVIAHREGRITIYARSCPRLSRGEVRRLRRDLFIFLPAGSDVRLKAIWSG